MNAWVMRVYFFKILNTELHNLNLKLCIKQYNKIDLLHQIVAPQLSGCWGHNYSTRTRHAGCINEQSMFLLCLWLWLGIIQYHTGIA
jgi:hypothetical protein